ncbi:MAG: hypothetical protein WKF37_16060 [Bryobacteraceae bacterium]
MFLALIVITPSQSLSQVVRYNAVELLGASDGAQAARALNSAGDVAGRFGSFLATDTQAIIWSFTSKRSTFLATLFRREYSSAAAMNDSGEVVGTSNSDTSIVPWLWTPRGGMQLIPLLPGHNGGQAFGINKKGEVVGYATGPGGARAFLWTRRDVQDLGVLPGGSHSRALAVNDEGDVVGTSDSPDGERAFLWTTVSGLRSLGTLAGYTSSEAMAINNAGDVVGYATGSKGVRAFLWTRTTGMQDLGALPGGTSSRALAISNSGAVVGSSTTLSGDRAFLWTWEAGLKDLNAVVPVNLAVVFVEAHAINSKGQILVIGTDRRQSLASSGPATDDHEHGDDAHKAHNAYSF